MGNHPDNQRSEADQWPHHFNMLGQLLLGFIFLIVVFFLYVTHYLRGKRAERMRARGKMQMTGAMQGGGVAGLSQLRAKLSGKSYDHAAGYERLSASSMEEGAGGSLSRGNLKRTGSGSSFGSGGSLLESVRYLEQQKGGGGSR